MTVEEIQRDPEFQTLDPAVQKEVLRRLSGGGGPTPTRSNLLHRDLVWRQDRPIARGTMQIARPLLQVLGMTGGATLAAPTAPITFGLGPVAGAGGGYAAGDQLADYLAWGLGLRPPPTLQSQSQEVVKDVPTGMMYEMGGQVVGNLATRGLSRLAAPVAIDKSARELEPIRQRLDLSRKYGVPLDPGDISQSANVNRFERVLDWIPGSASVMHKNSIQQLQGLEAAYEKMRQRGAPPETLEALGTRIIGIADDLIRSADTGQRNALTKMREQLVKTIGTTKGARVVGGAAQTGLAQQSRLAQHRAREPFQRLGEEFADLQIPISNLQKKSQELLARQLQTPYSELRNPDVEQLLKAIADPDNASTMTWNQITATMDDLFSKQQATNAALKVGAKVAGGGSTESHVFNELRRALEADRKAFIRGAAVPELASEYSTARKGYSAFKKLYDTKFARAIATANPEDVGSVIFKPNGLTEVETAKRALGPAYEGLASRFATDLVGDGSSATIQKNIARYGDDMVKAALGSARYGTLKKVAARIARIENLPVSDPLVTSLARTNPGAVFDTIIKSGTQRTRERIDAQNLARLNTILPHIGDSGRQALAAKTLERIFARRPRNEYLLPSDLVEMRANYGVRTLQRLLPERDFRELTDLATLAQSMVTAQKTAANPSGTAQGVLTGGTYLAALYAVLSGNLASAAKIAGATGISDLLARLYVSPVGRQWLSVGFRLPPGSPLIPEIVAKTAAVVLNQEPEPGVVDAAKTGAVR